MGVTVSGVEDLLISVGIDWKSISTGARELRSTIGKVGKSVAKVQPQFTNFDNVIKNLNKDVQRGMTPFAGWAMSIMFAGMAVQRTFKQIAKTSLKTFQDITHSVEGQVTNLDILEGSWKYLQFSIGEALDPLFDKLAPIVDIVTEWTQKHPKLTAAIVEFGIVLGTLAMVGGGLQLAINGFKDMFRLAGSLKSFDWKGLGNSIRNGIGIVTIGIGFFTAADAIKKLTEEDGEGTIKNMLSLLGGVMEMYGGFMFMKGTKGGIWMAAIGFALDKTAKGTFFKSIGTFLAPITALISTFIEMVIHNAGVMWAALNGDFSQTTKGFRKVDYANNLAEAKQIFADMDTWASDVLSGSGRNFSIPSDAPTAAEWKKQQAVTYNINQYLYGMDTQKILDDAKRQYSGVVK